LVSDQVYALSGIGWVCWVLLGMGLGESEGDWETGRSWKVDEGYDQVITRTK
jgi:hypothetical protein